MAYKNDLKWQKQFGDFTPEEQKVLLALSHDKYRWRTRERLLDLTRFEPKSLDGVLAELLRRDLIRPGFSKNRHIIFGLRERVG